MFPLWGYVITVRHSHVLLTGAVSLVDWRGPGTLAAAPSNLFSKKLIFASRCTQVSELLRWTIRGVFV